LVLWDYTANQKVNFMIGGRPVGESKIIRLLGGVGDNKTKMKDEGEMMNEGSNRFPLFDLDFNF
jgi:hypothetical protein